MLLFCVLFSNQEQFRKNFKENPPQEGKLQTSVAAHEREQGDGETMPFKPPWHMADREGGPRAMFLNL